MTRLQPEFAKASWIIVAVLTGLLVFAWAGTAVGSINLPQRVAEAIAPCRP